MQRRRVRHRIHALVRLVVTCAVTALTIGTLISVQVLFDDTSSSSASSSSSFSPLSSESTSILVADPYTVYGRRKISGHNESGQMRSMQEFSPPQLSKVSHYLKLWKKPSNQDFIPCMNPSQTYSAPGESRGYLLVHTNGGLNQMRAGISDMVAIARIINATLVIPKLDKGSYWQDLSNFSDVFDEKHFTQYLYNDIKLIKKIPKKLKRVMKANKQFRSWSGVDYYHNVISSLWKNYKIIIASKSDSRLANNNLPLDIQRLRCRVFYEALRFAPQIEALGKLLVERMRSYGPYIALHLRYEKDMLAFSGCTYGLSAREADELTKLRENTTHWKVKDIDPYEQRIKGHCPLTPKEIGIFLSLMGYPPTTPIYIAAGEIYGGDNHMADLEARFPIILNKAKLASAEELAPFTNYATQMAALDYIVAVESDVFVPSYSGNMARAVEGHRRFLGHRKTISPDRRELVRLFDKIASQNGGDEHSLQQEMNLSSNKVIEIHRKRLGSPRKRKGPISGTKGTDRFRSEEPFYENPLPDCLCYKGPITSR